MDVKYTYGKEIEELDDIINLISAKMRKKVFKDFLTKYNSTFDKKAKHSIVESVCYDSDELKDILDSNKKDQLLIKEIESNDDEAVVNYYSFQGFDKNILAFIMTSIKNDKLIFGVGLTTMEGDDILFEVF